MYSKKLLVFLIVLLISFPSIKTLKAQINKLNFVEARRDTIYGEFLDNFEYDVMIVYLDGIEVYNGILYSSKQVGNAKDSFKIYNSEPISRNIRIDVYLYQRNQKASLRYNPLWYKWDENRDIAFYFKVVKLSTYFSTLQDGNLISIGLGYDELGMKYPIIKFSKLPIISE